jgi:hypothetical protein
VNGRPAAIDLLSPKIITTDGKQQKNYKNSAGFKVKEKTDGQEVY